MKNLTMTLAVHRRRKPAIDTVAVFLLTELVAGCASPFESSDPVRPSVDPNIAAMYGLVTDGDYTVPAINVSKIDPKYLRQIVDYHGDEQPGRIVVDPCRKFPYLVMGDGKAVRYGVGVAKAGIQFEGSATIARKAKWPNWAPTADMIKRNPELYGPFAARALYLYRDGKDTLCRLHDTTAPWSIGKNISSGCIRLFNQDILDLYRRIPRGTGVVVLGPEDPSPILTGNRRKLT